MGAPKTKKPAIETVADYVTGTLPGITLAAVAANLKVSELRPCGHNFRKDFDPAALAELAESIRTVGVLQPLVVLERRTGEFGSVTRQILCGERRWRAAQLAGVDSVPCMVHTGLTDLQVLEMVATENLARRDMNPHETLLAYQALRDAGLRPGEIAAKAGVAPAEVTKLLALERLPAEALELLRENDGKRLSVSAGYQIAQKWADYPKIALALCRYSASGSISVRELEQKELPYGIEQRLAETNAARYPNWQQSDRFKCKSCKEYKGRLCLAPEEFDRKVAALKAEEIAQAEARQRELAARALPMAGSSKKAKDAAESVLRIEDLKYSDYERLGKDRPEECKQGCPCLAVAIDVQGNSCEICINPKRHQGVKSAATREKNKQVKEQAKAQIAQVKALRCTDPDDYADAPKGTWLAHEHLQVLSLALALRKLLGSCSVAGKRHAIAMLPTGEDLARANQPVNRDADGKAIVPAAYEEAAAGLREYFNPASTHANRDDAWPGLIQGISSTHPDMRPQILLAAVGAVCCDELENKSKNPGWYRTEHTDLALAEMPTTETLYQMLRHKSEALEMEPEEEAEATEQIIESEDEPEAIPLRVSSKTFSDVYENHRLMKHSRNAWIFRHGGSAYFAFPDIGGKNNDGEPIQAKRVKEASDAEKEGITLRFWSAWADLGVHLGMVVSDHEGKRWAICDDTLYEVLDVTEMLPPAEEPS